MLVTDLFLASVATRPDELAVVDDTTTMTWAQLATAVAQARSWLDLEGLETGDRLVYGAVPDHRMVIFMWACLFNRLAFVPVHQELTPEQVGHISTDCSARLVMTSPAVATTLDLPIYQRVTDDTDRWRHASPTTVRDLAPQDDDHALLIYTSGTTGRPKGVACRNHQVAAATRAIGSCLEYRPDDVILVRLPLAFDYGLYQLLLAAQVGACVVLSNRRNDLQLLSDVVRHGVSVIPLVPSIAQMLTILQRRRRTETSVRLFTNTGARLSPPVLADLLQYFPGAEYASMYGMTECKRISILPPVEYETYPESVGYAIPGDTILIVDPSGTPTAPGVMGEIVVRGATVMDGYWGVPLHQQSRFRLGPEGIELHTGDQGWLDRDGRLYFVGRDDDIIKRRGMRISLHEIEDAAEQVDGVDAAIALKPSIEDGSLELVYSGSCEPDRLKRQLADRLDQARRPSLLTRVDILPLTANGKPDRKALQEARSQADAAPVTAQSITV